MKLSLLVSNLFDKMDRVQDCYIDYLPQAEAVLLNLKPRQLEAFKAILDRILACNHQS
jgi:hypothetical protein